VICDALAGRTERLVAVGGATGSSLPTRIRAGRTWQAGALLGYLQHLCRGRGDDGRHKLGLRMVEAMNGLFAHHAAGDYRATYVGYPVNYGPRTPGPYDWSVIRRILDGRRRS